MSNNDWESVSSAEGDDLQVADDYGEADYDEGPDRHTEEWYQKIKAENPQFTDDEIALLVACHKQNLCEVRHLLASNVNPNFSLNATTCPLFDAIVGLPLFPSDEDRTTWKAIIKCLLEAGANPNTSVPMLLVAFDRHDMDVITWLLDHGADPNFVGSDGSCILASVFNYLVHSQVAPMLIKLGADVRAISRASGWSALHCAACNNKVDSVRLVIRAGCLITSKDTWGKKTPMYYVITIGDKDTVQLLLQAGYNIHKDDDIPACIESVREVYAGDHDFIDWFITECSQPAPLKRQCRTIIRDVIGGVNLEDKIKKSNLPDFLKPYLLLDELL